MLYWLNIKQARRPILFFCWTQPSNVMKSTRCPGMSDTLAKPSNHVWINQMPNSLLHSQHRGFGTAQSLLMSGRSFSAWPQVTVSNANQAQLPSCFGLWSNMNFTDPWDPLAVACLLCGCLPRTLSQNPSQPVLVLPYPTHTQNSNNPKSFSMEFHGPGGGPVN